MAIGKDNMFDFGNLLVNEISGDVIIAMVLGLIVTVFLAVKYKMPLEAIIIIIVLFLLVFYIYVELSIIIVFVVLFIGTLFYYTVSKMINR